MTYSHKWLHSSQNNACRSQKEKPILPDDWKIAFEGQSRQACADRALVLHSLDIPYEIIVVDGRSLLIVPHHAFERAKYELWQYDTENANAVKPQPLFSPVYQNAVPGVVVYVFVVCLVAWLASEAAFSKDWFAAGRIDGVLIREGEWWRAFTALTLHSGIGHLAGNIGFGVVFGLLAGSLTGSGASWLAIVLAAAAGNLANTYLLDSVHRAIGASTAVFAALGVVAGFSWRARLMPQNRWAYRYGPIVGGIALLTYTGTGDENTDIGAHLAGFVCGFGAGMLLTMMSKFLPRLDVQLFSGVSALLLIVLAWSLAL